MVDKIREEKVEAIKKDLLELCQKHQITITADNLDHYEKSFIIVHDISDNKSIVAPILFSTYAINSQWPPNTDEKI